MPMGGEGSRFKVTGVNTPKPLILANGIPFYQRALNSVNGNFEKKVSAIIRAEHVKEYNLDKSITQFCPDSKIYTIDKTTGGAVQTCLIADIADDDAVLILDCDFEFRSKSFMEYIASLLNEDADDRGAVLSFYSDKTKYSYAKVDENNFVVRTAEKQVISNNALCGAYFFNSGLTFKKVAYDLIDDCEAKEFYTSLLYNRLPLEQNIVKLFKVDEYRSFGTPEELEIYEKLVNNQ